MLSDAESEQATKESREQPERPDLEPCPQCGFPMVGIRGSKEAICRNCGFKDSCCY